MSSGAPSWLGRQRSIWRAATTTALCSAGTACCCTSGGLRLRALGSAAEVWCTCAGGQASAPRQGSLAGAHLQTKSAYRQGCWPPTVPVTPLLCAGLAP